MGALGGHRAQMRADLSVRIFGRRAGRDMDPQRPCGRRQQCQRGGRRGAGAKRLRWSIDRRMVLVSQLGRRRRVLEGAKPSGLGQIAMGSEFMTPVAELRRPLTSGVSLYLEGGIGIHLLSHTRIDGRDVEHGVSIRRVCRYRRELRRPWAVWRRGQAPAYFERLHQGAELRSHRRGGSPFIPLGMIGGTNSSGMTTFS